MLSAEPPPGADGLQRQLAELSVRYADTSQQQSALSTALGEAERREAALRHQVEALQARLEQQQQQRQQQVGLWVIPVGRLFALLLKRQPQFCGASGCAVLYRRLA